MSLKDIGTKVQMIMVETKDEEDEDDKKDGEEGKEDDADKKDGEDDKEDEDEIDGKDVDETLIYVRALQEISPEEDIFLIDHMWTFKRE